MRNFFSAVLLGAARKRTYTTASRGLVTRSTASPDGRLIAEILSKEAKFAEDTVRITSVASGFGAEFPMTSKAVANGRNVELECRMCRMGSG